MKFKNKLSLLTSVFSLVLVGATTHADDEQVAMKRSYDFIMNSANPSEEMQKYIQQLKSIYARAELRVEQFDHAMAKTDQPIDLMNSPEYRRVSTMHLIRERAEDKIAFVYDQLKQDVSTQNFADASRMKADQVLRTLESELDSSNTADQLIFADLKSKLSSDSGFTSHPRDFTPEEFSQTHADFLATAQLEENQQSPLSKEIKTTDRDLKKIEFAAPANLMARIGPSAGAGGSISGREFPKGTWALTYDDGPHPSYTMQDVANLRANGAKATFFWLARNTGLYPGVIRGVQNAGFPVEDHSWNHPSLNSPKNLASMHTTLQHEIVDSANTEAAQYGVRPRYFRCPYGAGINSPAVRQLIAQQGMVNVFWNVDSLDWQDHNPASIVARVQKQMAAQGRGIILFHDIHPQSVTASAQLMVAQRGRVSWVTIPEGVDRANGGR